MYFNYNIGKLLKYNNGNSNDMYSNYNNFEVKSNNNKSFNK